MFHLLHSQEPVLSGLRLGLTRTPSRGPVWVGCCLGSEGQEDVASNTQASCAWASAEDAVSKMTWHLARNRLDSTEFYLMGYGENLMNDEVSGVALGNTVVIEAHRDADSGWDEVTGAAGFQSDPMKPPSPPALSPRPAHLLHFVLNWPPGVLQGHLANLGVS